MADIHRGRKTLHVLLILGMRICGILGGRMMARSSGDIEQLAASFIEPFGSTSREMVRASIFKALQGIQAFIILCCMPR